MWASPAGPTAGEDQADRAPRQAPGHARSGPPGRRRGSGSVAPPPRATPAGWPDRCGPSLKARSEPRQRGEVETAGHPARGRPRATTRSACRRQNRVHAVTAARALVALSTTKSNSSSMSAEPSGGLRLVLELSPAPGARRAFPPCPTGAETASPDSFAQRGRAASAGLQGQDGEGRPLPAAGPAGPAECVSLSPRNWSKRRAEDPALLHQAEDEGAVDAPVTSLSRTARAVKTCALRRSARPDSPTLPPGPMDAGRRPTGPPVPRVSSSRPEITRYMASASSPWRVRYSPASTRDNRHAPGQPAAELGSEKGERTGAGQGIRPARSTWGSRSPGRPFFVKRYGLPW
jgi:hypothetical protein